VTPRLTGWLQERLINKAVAEDPGAKDFLKQFDEFAKENAPAQTRDDVGAPSMRGAKIANYRWKRDTLAIAQQMFDKGAEIFNPKSSNYIGALAPKGADYVKTAQDAAANNRDVRYYNRQFQDPGMTPKDFIKNRGRIGVETQPQPSVAGRKRYERRFRARQKERQ
jgi:hypothetical protein